MSWKLKRVRQCEKCPWRKGINPHDIPNGYDVEKHRAIENTIAKSLNIDFETPLRTMACHETHEAHCVGWLHNQLGSGNNIMLRLQMRDCENAKGISLRGEQHEKFEDTLPEDG
jgi:hypothetical protein